MTTIKRNSPVPLYHQLKELLSDRINNGEWQGEFGYQAEKS